jgi:membrane-associated phospholipid phosphatase
LSTVYGRYHYVADIVGGMVTGTLGYLVGRWLMRKSEQLRGGWEGAEFEKRACGQKGLCEN